MSVGSLPHIPVLRHGKVYESLERSEVVNHRTGEPLALLSQANAGLIRRDLSKIGESFEILRKIPIGRILDICRKAGELFMSADLPLGVEGSRQSPQQYVETLSATSGLPHTLCRRNMAKVNEVFTEMPTILKGLTRGLDLEILDRGFGEQNGVPVSYYPTSRSLGVALPSNSPGVNSIWMPAVALKVPVVLKPGREEPWTPWRIIQAFIAAGMPPEAFTYCPTDHEGSGTILKGCERAILFGDQSTIAQYANNPAVQVHGPGWSKVLVGEDWVERWPEFLDVLVASVADNGGRSCINASAIVVPRLGKEIAEALAERLATIEPCTPEDENARLSAFANTKMAEFIDATITEGLTTPGAEEVTARYRKGARKVELDGSVYVLPTVVRCDSFAHPLANKEFLCPYTSVVEVPQARMLEQVGPSLVVTAITEDSAFIEQIVASPHIERLNLGPIPTSRVRWDQPHEGNLFEFLYKRRAIQR
ncbi:MAG: hypothetical protein GHCLOJNM_02944 [bacterium]|nr:hypothetical protein [bacterium]